MDLDLEKEITDLLCLGQAMKQEDALLRLGAPEVILRGACKRTRESLEKATGSQYLRKISGDPDVARAPCFVKDAALIMAEVPQEAPLPPRDPRKVRATVDLFAGEIDTTIELWNKPRVIRVVESREILTLWAALQRFRPSDLPAKAEKMSLFVRENWRGLVGRASTPGTDDLTGMDYPFSAERWAQAGKSPLVAFTLMDKAALLEWTLVRGAEYLGLEDTNSSEAVTDLVSHSFAIEIAIKHAEENFTRDRGTVAYARNVLTASRRAWSVDEEHPLASLKLTLYPHRQVGNKEAESEVLARHYAECQRKIRAAAAAFRIVKATRGIQAL